MVIITIIIIIIALWSSIPGERTLPWDRPGAPGHCQRLWRPWLSGDVPAARRWWKSSSSTGHPKMGETGGEPAILHGTSMNISDIYWLVVWNIFYFSIYIGNVIIPNWLWYFQRCWNHQPVKDKMLLLVSPTKIRDGDPIYGHDNPWVILFGPLTFKPGSPKRCQTPGFQLYFVPSINLLTKLLTKLADRLRQIFIDIHFRFTL